MAEYSRIVVGMLFLIAGLLKIRGPKRFVNSVAGYGITSRQWLTKYVAYAIIALEMVLAIDLVFGVSLPLSVTGALFLLLIFTAVTVLMLIRGKKGRPCGCMILGRKELLGWNVCIRNVALGCLLVPSVVKINAAVFIGIATIILVGTSVLSNNTFSYKITPKRS